jgi:tellurite resistance protein TerC
MSHAAWLWTGFLSLVAVILVLDLGVLNRRARAVSSARALFATGVFVLLALAFTVVVYWAYDGGHLGAAAISFDGQPMTGRLAAAEYLQGWMLEYSLSVDNLFLFALLFAHFKVPSEMQHRVLFWGIIGALVLRGVMILAGAALIAAFHWVIYLFGAILLITAVKMLTMGEHDVDPEQSRIVRIARRLIPMSPTYDGSRFLTRAAPTAEEPNPRLKATPLLLVLIIVEFTDVLFAIDSIPAIFGVTREPFIVFTSNVFAILGLRSLYFALAGLIDKFRFLKLSLCVVLGFIGLKMVLSGLVHVSGVVSLGVVASTLVAGVVASWLLPAPLKPANAETAGNQH